jgi:hypothetical protein
MHYRANNTILGCWPPQTADYLQIYASPLHGCSMSSDFTVQLIKSIGYWAESQIGIMIFPAFHSIRKYITEEAAIESYPDPVESVRNPHAILL